jgi:hypothetical protein
MLFLLDKGHFTSILQTRPKTMTLFPLSNNGCPTTRDAVWALRFIENHKPGVTLPLAVGANYGGGTRDNNMPSDSNMLDKQVL